MHRHDNIIQRVLAVPGLLVSLIPDGIHLPPFVMANLARCLGVSQTAMTTDAMSAAGAPVGEYTLGPLRLVVGEDRVVRHPSGRNFAGSCLTPSEGFFNLLRFGGYGARDAWSAWTRLRDYLFPGIETSWLMLPFAGTPTESARDETSRN
jgi:N-acetylglucosamine-6-phosphate deacetylase